MPSVEIELLGTDDDSMLFLVVYAKSESHSVAHESYVYPDELRTFAASLRAFPRSLGDEVVFETGSRAPEWAGFLSLRAYVLRPTGHSALAVEAMQRGDTLRTSESTFAIGALPADLNRLGAELEQWLADPSRRLVVSWRNY